jgi:hypothetical protein
MKGTNYLPEATTKKKFKRHKSNRNNISKMNTL